MGPPCEEKYVIYAYFVCGKPFTCSFAFTAGCLGWGARAVVRTRGWVRCVYSRERGETG